MPEPKDLVSVSVRIPRATADAFQRICDREYRAVAAEVRRLIQERVDTYDENGHDEPVAA